jgi:hypothetical protein
MFRRLDCRGDYIINARLSLLGVQLEESNWWIPIFTWICVVLPFKNLNGILYIGRRTDGHVKLTHIEEEEALVLNVSDGWHPEDKMVSHKKPKKETKEARPCDTLGGRHQLPEIQVFKHLNVFD